MADFYIYFDNQKQIVSVSGRKDPTSPYRYTVFSREDAIGFMDGSMRTSEYQIVENRKTGKIAIEKKKTSVISIQTLDDKLYKIEPLTTGQFDVKIIHKNNSLHFKLNAEKRENLLGDASDITINGASTLEFFITSKDDPHFLKKHISINVADFIKQDIKVEYEQDLDISIYTKRVYEDYCYEDRR